MQEGEKRLNSIKDSLYQEIPSKYVLLIRHGEIDNPNNVVYSRDNLEKSGNIVHLNAHGKEQMETLGKLITQGGFNIRRVLVSPETRTQESAIALDSNHNFPQAELDDDLDDAFAAGSYLEWLRLNPDKTNVDLAFEAPKVVVVRMNRVFVRVIETLQTGESAILVTHADPINYFLSSFLTDKLPNPQEAESPFYPEKGTGFVVILNSGNQVVANLPLNPDLTDDSKLGKLSNSK